MKTLAIRRAINLCFPLPSFMGLFTIPAAIHLVPVVDSVLVSLAIRQSDHRLPSINPQSVDTKAVARRLPQTGSSKSTDI